MAGDGADESTLPAAMWLGQLLATAWLDIAALNWLQRGPFDPLQEGGN